MAKNDKSTELATSGASSLAGVGRDIRQSSIEVIGSKDSITANAVTAEQMMDILNTAKDAEHATELLHQLAGIVPFANKRIMALDGTSFTVTKLVIREKGGFSKKDDVAALIQTADGSLEVLTFEQNEGRNNFLVGLHANLQKWGKAPNWSLQLYGSDNVISALMRGERPDEGDKYFYAMVPTPFWKGYGETYTQESVVTDAEFTQVH